MARYSVRVSEKLEAYIYVEIEADDADVALEKARKEAFATPLKFWSITQKDSDMQYEEEE